MFAPFTTSQSGLFTRPGSCEMSGNSLYGNVITKMGTLSICVSKKSFNALQRETSGQNTPPGPQKAIQESAERALRKDSGTPQVLPESLPPTPSGALRPKRSWADGSQDRTRIGARMGKAAYRRACPCTPAGLHSATSASSLSQSTSPQTTTERLSICTWMETVTQILPVATDR